MSLSPFGHSKLKIDRRARPRPDEATLSDFSGGLDLTDNDLKLKTNFSKVLNNINRDIDGTLSVRFGTSLKFNVSGTVTGNILEMVYFRDKIVVFTDTGQICTIDSAGTKTIIWSSAIAALLPGAPAGWSSGLTIIDTTEFKNELVVNNGVDKPILISKTHTVTYLQDLATGSNVFTPIGKYTTTVGNYVVIAGITASPDDLYISAAGTSGTWPGDPAPNDSTTINIAAYTAETGSNIRGLSSFRNYLVVHFATSSVVIRLGNYDGTTHKPQVLDTIARQGLVGHRMVHAFNEELLVADDKGVHISKRNVFDTGLDSEKISARIQPKYVASIPTTDANRLASFSVLNELENRILYFFKQASGFDIYVLSYDEQFKRRAWNTYSGWGFTAACTSFKGRVFLSIGTKIYQHGNEVYPDELFTGDLMDDADSTWATTTAYTTGHVVVHSGEYYLCLIDHTSGVFDDDFDDGFWEVFGGDTIDFDWELPWTDTNTRMRKKRLSYIGIDSVGSAAFTIEAYTDNFRFDENDLDDPALTIDFVGGSSIGYGGPTQPYGGGRRAADERLWGYPCEFKIIKLRVKGQTNERLKLVQITLLYSRGTYKR